MNFTREEFVQMVYCIGEAEGNVLLASRIYRAKHPDLRSPRTDTIQKLKERFEESGSVSYKKRKDVSRITEEQVLEVLLSIEENPNTSTREMAREIDMSKSTVNRILHKHKFHPYHMELHQELYGDDFGRRVEFCEHMQGLIHANNRFLDLIIFSDEAAFRSNGSVNRHNMHYYATENPKWLRTVDSQNRWSLNVWGGIVGQYLLGPHFFEETLTGLRYLQFVQRNLPVLLQDVDLRTRQAMWLQHDGAPAHYHRSVREYLDEVFPNRWIGRGGTIAWPARSPDLTPIDFFLWGYVKEKVYKVKPTTVVDMQMRIRQAFRDITPEILTRVKLSFIKRLQVCSERNGDLFEHLLN